MKAIVIGAGRGSRLGDATADRPKACVEVLGRPLLDWILDAFHQAGIPRDRVVFVAGWAERAVREGWPDLCYVTNPDWASTNILASLMVARDHMTDGFVSTYADILYEPGIVSRLLAAPESIVLGCDVEWRRRYVGRSMHPESDAEKLRAEGRRVVALSRHVPNEEATGEFIGVMRCDAAGARTLIDGYDRARARAAGGLYREGRTFERAYLIDLLQDLLEAGVVLHREDTLGGYMELDTPEDLSLAEQWRRSWPP